MANTIYSNRIIDYLHGVIKFMWIGNTLSKNYWLNRNFPETIRKIGAEMSFNKACLLVLIEKVKKDRYSIINSFELSGYRVQWFLVDTIKKPMQKKL